METSINVLILEHDANDIELLQYQLKKSDLNHTAIVVQTKQDYTGALTQFGPDIILSDYSLPAFDGLSAFRIKQEIAPDLPFIIVSGTIGEENAVELIKMGVTDYVLKENLYQIPFKLQRALNETADRKQKAIAQKQLQEREEQLQKIMDLSRDVICTVDGDGRFVTVGAASNFVWGYAPGELIGTRVIDLVHEEDKDRTYKAILNLRNGTDMVNFENQYTRKDGSFITMYWSARWDNTENLGYSIAHDATGIKKAEEELVQQHTLVNNILESISDGFFAVDEDWTVIYWNKVAERLLHTAREEILGTRLWDIFKVGTEKKFFEEYHRVMAEQVSTTFEDYYAPFNAWFEITASPAKNRLVVSFRDITAKKRKQQLMLLEKELLEMYTVQKSSLADAITNLLEKLQAHYPGMYCAVLRMKEGTLKSWGSGRFPDSLRNTIGELDFSKTSCGVAVALKEKITVTDISTDIRWEEHRELFVQHGLRGCTAYPICDAKNKALGVLGIFLTEPRGMNACEAEIAEFIVNILKPLIESKLATLALQESEGKYRNLFDLSPLPMWVSDSSTLRFLDVNAAAMQHYGYSRQEFKKMTLQDIRPEEDMNSFENEVMPGDVSGNVTTGVHRHVKKNGEVIFVDVRGNVIELNGGSAKIILATDISERLKYTQAMEDQNKRLREIAWVQSHVVRAPLARIMGLIHLLDICPANEAATSDILRYISSSARELDGIIKDIVTKAEQVKDQL